MLIGQLIEESPNRAEYYITRSNVSRELGQNELALLDVDKAIELEPDNANFHKLRSILLKKLGKTEASERSINRANRLTNKP